MPAHRAAQALEDAAQFFARPQAERDALGIRSSQHFRGYSVMKNDRDWREQIHFGRERPNAGDTPPWRRLEGPNLWPADSAWRRRLLEYLEATENVAAEILSRLAESFGLPLNAFDSRNGYSLLKLIAYHPQTDPAARRSGVAAHLDFSWLTLTLQDETGGLEVETLDGVWRDVPPVAGAWLVNVGEILQFATGNTLRATPHRVINPSTERTRFSIPVFLCPDLDAVVSAKLPYRNPPLRQDGSHIHRVLDSSSPPTALHFGIAEWQRKGENLWCRECTAPLETR